MKDLDRRNFMGKAGRFAAGLGTIYIAATLPGCGNKGVGTAPIEPGPAASPEDIPVPQEAKVPPTGLVVVKGSDTSNMLRAGLEAWGGLQSLEIGRASCRERV